MGNFQEKYPPLTKGEEFEFCLVWRWQRRGEEMQTPGTAQLVSGVIVVPLPDPTEPTATVGSWIRKCCYTEVWKLLSRNNVAADCVLPSCDLMELSTIVDHANPNAANTDDPIYYHWSLNPDISVYFDTEELRGRLPEEYGTLDLELASPALLDAPESYVEVDQVLKIIKNNLFILVPDRAGFHVHVGIGKQRFKTRHLRKIAAALFMLDPIFSALHPDSRQENEFCWRNRLYSNLAQGMTAKTAQRTASDDQPVEIHPPNGKYNIVRGVQELLNANSTGAVANLMRTPNRGAFNFRSYDLLGNGKPANPRPTIEFRQGAGTVNEVWAACWARICVGTVDWARRASRNELFRCARRCHRAERGARKYDAETFVRDVLKLPDDAAYIRAHSPTQRANPPVDPESLPGILSLASFQSDDIFS